MPKRETAEATFVQPKFLSVRNAERISGLSRATLYRLNNSEKLKFYKVGGRTLIAAAELDALILGS